MADDFLTQIEPTLPKERVTLRVTRWLVGALVTAVFAPVSLAASPEEVMKATPLIVETAKQICAAVSNAGSSQSAQAKGEVNAGLDGLFKKLASVGVSGQAEWDKLRYEGLPQADLATALKNEDECRTKIFNKMLDTMFPGTTTGAVQAPYIGYQPTGEFETELRYLLEISGVRKGMKTMLENTLQNILLQLKIQHPNEPDRISAYEEIMADAMPRYDDIVDEIVPIYQRNFKVGQIQELNKFYSTPAMREMTNELPLIMQEVVPLQMKLARNIKAKLIVKLNEWEEAHKAQ